MRSHETNIVVSKIRGFLQAVFTTPASAHVLDQERLGVIYQNAIRVYEQALAKHREVLGENHPSTATDYNNLGEAWHSLGQYRKASENFEKALDIFRGTLPKGHPSIRNVEQNLAEARTLQTK